MTRTAYRKNRLRKAVQFFCDHAGYASPPGKLKCARMLAQAEERAVDLGLRFVWSLDEMPWDGDEEPKMVECCVVYPERGQTALASLCGIGDATDQYRRVVEAELALEALEGV